MQFTMSKLWLLFVIVLPLASPFGVGIHAGTATPSRHNTSNQFSPSIKTLSMPPLSAANNRSKTLMQGTDTSEKIIQKESDEKTTNGGSNSPPMAKKRSPITRIGSALFYTYVGPLLRTASERQLEETDVFPTPDSVKMDNQVPELESVYSRCKAKAQHRNLRSSLNGSQNKSLKNKLNGRVSKSESLILAKALFLHLKKSIIVTGLLRLLNTAIQAFPALLVARLLRLIEAGDTAHPSRAIRAALDLVAVLSVKIQMVVEKRTNTFTVLSNVRPWSEGLCQG